MREIVMKYVSEQIKLLDAAKQSQKECQDEDNRLHKLFIKDLEEENDLQDNPKKDLLWAKAWELGHSSGYDEVITIYEDLMELIK
jgi:hypothetical protein